MTVQYKYASQLRDGEIRVLKLKPGSQDEALHFELETCTFGTTSYDAVSYAWGDPKLDHEAFCEGQKVPITKSLYTLMRAFRPAEGDGPRLWIDAVCINQTNVQERTEQVRRMSDIYRAAESVVVWLGEGYEDTEQGLQLLARTCEVYPSLNGEKIEDLWLDDENQGQGYESATQLEALGLLDTSLGGWQMAAKLLHYTWFTRRWVIQEVLNARKRVFRIGKHKVTPEVLLGGFYRIASMPGLRFALDERQRRVAENIDNMVQLLRRSHGDFSHAALCELLLETADFHSSDVRDRIFAIVGCFDNPPVTLVDYAKAFPALLLDVIRCEDSREALVEAVFRGMCYIDCLPDDTDIPSWIPTFKFSTKVFAPISVDEDDGNIDADQADLRIIDDRILGSTAVFFDEVNVCSEAQEYADPLPFWYHSLEEQREVLESAVRKDCEIRLEHLRIAKDAKGVDDFDLEHFLACQLFGHIPEDLDIAASYTAGMWYNALTFARSEYQTACDVVRLYNRYSEHFQVPQDDALTAESTEEEILSRLNELADLRDYLAINSRLKYRRRFFASKGGLIGWVPAASCSGDRICVLFGNAIPIVLRPSRRNALSNNSTSYKFIGTAYVHDYMDGEPFQNDYLPRECIQII